MERQPAAHPDNIQEIVAEAAQLVTERRTDDAARIALTHAHSLQEQGFSHASQSLLIEIQGITSLSAISPDLRAEFLILRGLTEAWQGLLEDASRSFNAALALVPTDKPSK